MTASVENSDTIKTIKEHMQEQSKIPITEFVFVLEGKTLQDKCIVSDCNIKSKLKIRLKIGKNVCSIYVTKLLNHFYHENIILHVGKFSILVWPFEMMVFAIERQ